LLSLLKFEDFLNKPENKCISWLGGDFVQTGLLKYHNYLLVMLKTTSAGIAISTFYSLLLTYD